GPVCANLPGTAQCRVDVGRRGASMSGSVVTADGPAAGAGSLIGNLTSLLQPWRARAIAVVLFVLAAASFELAPPFIVRTLVVEALDTVFSSGVAVLVANLVRLLTLTVGMLILSPALTLVAALVAPPLVITLRFLQVRVRQSERASRIAIGALTSRLQESLRGIEVVRAFGRESEATGGFRLVLRDALAASNRATRFSALYTPVTAILASFAWAAP